MTYGLEQEVESIPGNHLLAAEFVAVDHGPFAPRVIAEVAFVVWPDAHGTAASGGQPR